MKKVEVNRNIYDLIAQRIRSRWTIMTSKDSIDLLFRASLGLPLLPFQTACLMLWFNSSSLSLMLQRSNYILKISHMLKTSVWFSNQISLSLINAFSLFLKHVALIVVSLWPCQMIQLGKQCCLSFNFCSSIWFYIGRIISTFLAWYYLTTFYGSNPSGVREDSHFTDVFLLRATSQLRNQLWAARWFPDILRSKNWLKIQCLCP